MTATTDHHGRLAPSHRPALRALRTLLGGIGLLAMAALPAQAVTATDGFVQKGGSGGSTVQYFQALRPHDTDPASVFFFTLRNTAFARDPLVAFYDDGVQSGINNWGVARADKLPMPAANYSVVKRTQTDPANPGKSLVFVHQTLGNSSSNVTTLNNVYLNNNPNALVWFNQRASREETGRSDPKHPILSYSVARGRWQIINQGWYPYDVIVGESFNVIVEPADYAGASFFAQTSTATNTRILPNGQRAMRIDHPDFKSPRPDAVIIVAPVASPGCGWPANNFCNHPVGTTYNAQDNRWYVYYADFSHVPLDARFNIWIVRLGL